MSKRRMLLVPGYTVINMDEVQNLALDKQFGDGEPLYKIIVGVGEQGPDCLIANLSLPVAKLLLEVICGHITSDSGNGLYTLSKTGIVRGFDWTLAEEEMQNANR